MAIAFVTSASGKDLSGSGGTTIATNAWSLGSGELVFVCIRTATNSATISSVTDTASNTYVDSGVGPLAIPSSSGTMWVYYTYNSTSHASNVVTVNFSGSYTYRSITVTTYSGVQTTSDPKDVGNTGTAGGATSVTSGSFTPTTSGQVAIAGVCRNGSATVTSAGTDYTKRVEESASDSNYQNAIEDRLDAPTSSQQASASDATDWWGIIVRTFKASAESPSETARGLIKTFI